MKTRRVDILDTQNESFYQAGRSDGRFHHDACNTASIKDKEERKIAYVAGYAESATACTLEAAHAVAEDLVLFGGTGGRGNTQPAWYKIAQKSFNDKWSYALKKGKSAGADKPKSPKAAAFGKTSVGLKALVRTGVSDADIITFVKKALATLRA